MARRVSQLRPGVPVAYMSGYTDDVHAAEGDTPLLRKPFMPADLLAHVRRALGSEAAMRQSSPACRQAGQIGRTPARNTATIGPFPRHRVPACPFPMAAAFLSHYRLLGLLGVGGMGEVYRAEDSRLRREVAIKMLHPEAVTSKEWLGASAARRGSPRPCSTRTSARSTNWASTRGRPSSSWSGSRADRPTS